VDSKHWTGEPGPEHDPSASGDGLPYVCVSCDWQARGGIAALEHHVVTGHEVRGRDWPSYWENAQFSQPRKA
jgi:hypothetical protein